MKTTHTLIWVVSMLLIGTFIAWGSRLSQVRYLRTALTSMQEQHAELSLQMEDTRVARDQCQASAVATSQQLVELQRAYQRALTDKAALLHRAQDADDTARPLPKFGVGYRLTR